MGTAEIPQQVFLGAATFLLTDHDNSASFEKSGSADDGAVITESAIAMQFFKICENPFDVVGCVRPFRVAGDLDFLPRIEIRVDRLLRRLNFPFDGANLIRYIDIALDRKLVELGELFVEVSKWTFKLQNVVGLSHDFCGR